MWYLFITKPFRILSHNSCKYGMCYCENNKVISCYFADDIDYLFENLDDYVKPCGIYDIYSEFYIESFINSNFCTVLPIGIVMEDAKVLYPELFI